MRSGRLPVPPSWLVWTVVLLALGALLGVRVLAGDDPVTDEPLDDAPGWEVDRPVGETVRLTGGAVARVNGLEGDVTLAAGLPQPEPGTRLVRADVEVCAGEEERLVEPAFWVGLGDDGRVHSAHMGVRDFRTFTLAPGSCQRGHVDLALPEGVDLEAVLLMDESRTTAAAWAAGAQPGVLAPLDSGVEPETGTVGSPSDLATTGTVTLHEVVPDAGADEAGRVARLDGEVCAGEQRLLTGGGNWFLQTADHRLLPARRDGAAPAPAALDPGSCQRATVEFVVPASATLSAVVYTFGGVYEEARWPLGD